MQVEAFLLIEKHDQKMLSNIKKGIQNEVKRSFLLTVYEHTCSHIPEATLLKLHTRVYVRVCACVCVHVYVHVST